MADTASIALGAQSTQKAARDAGQSLLLAVIIAIVIIAAAVFLYFKRRRRPPAGGGPDPCGSSEMPALGSGVTCSPGARGTFAWLSTATPTKTGVVAAGLDPIRHLVATDASCVTESACQAYCLGDKACTYYAYDASGAAGSAGATTCPTAGAVCTTFSGGLARSNHHGPDSVCFGRDPGDPARIKIRIKIRGGRGVCALRGAPVPEH